MAQTVTNFKSAEMELLDRLSKGHSIRFADVEMIKLALYKKANSQIDWDEKNASMGEIKNIYGIDIEEFSDQVVKSNKIQGVRVSCGLHVHFSCAEMIHYEYEEDQYELVTLPIGIGEAGIPQDDETEMTSSIRLARELIRPTLYLYTRKGYQKKFEKKIYASRLNKPAIEYIVRSMDEKFFEQFAPAKADRTKYRQKGFYELKDYGFEYRSLPCNEKTLAALPEITAFAFDLLEEINEF